MNCSILLRLYLEKTACATHDMCTYMSIQGACWNTCHQGSYTGPTVKRLHIHQGANCSHKVWCCQDKPALSAAFLHGLLLAAAMVSFYEPWKHGHVGTNKEHRINQ